MTQKPYPKPDYVGIISRYRRAIAEREAAEKNYEKRLEAQNKIAKDAINKHSHRAMMDAAIQISAHGFDCETTQSRGEMQDYLSIEEDGWTIASGCLFTISGVDICGKPSIAITAFYSENSCCFTASARGTENDQIFAGNKCFFPEKLGEWTHARMEEFLSLVFTLNP